MLLDLFSDSLLCLGSWASKISLAKLPVTVLS